MLEHHIYRLTRGNHVGLSKTPPPDSLDDVACTCIASFTTAALRDLALAAFTTEITTKPDLYPNHITGKN